MLFDYPAFTMVMCIVEFLMYVIYRHINLTSGKCYIGKTKWSIESRWAAHVANALKGSMLYFARAIRKYPLESWTHEVIESVETNDEANLSESKWISHFKSNHSEHGYNMTKGGDGGMTCTSEQMSKKMKGKHKSKEFGQKMRDAMIRYWASSTPVTDARKQVFIERNQSDEARQKSREAQKRRWIKWHAENPSEPRQLLTKEERGKRISERMTGKKRGPYKNRNVE